MSLSEYEALQLITQLTQLRLNPQFQDAERTRRARGADQMAQNPGSSEYAQIWLLISTWERIAIFANEFSTQQLHKFFRCAPAGLIWKQLKPAVDAIRADDAVGETFAREFEALASLYTSWTCQADGQQFRTESAQSVHACFG